MDNIDTCKRKKCSLQFTHECIKSDAFPTKTFDQKHESLEDIMTRFKEVILTSFKLESVDIISRFVPKYGHIGIIKINEIETFRSNFKETLQEAINCATVYVERHFLEQVEIVITFKD